MWGCYLTAYIKSTKSTRMERKKEEFYLQDASLAKSPGLDSQAYLSQRFCFGFEPHSPCSYHAGLSTEAKEG